MIRRHASERPRRRRGMVRGTGLLAGMAVTGGATAAATGYYEHVYLAQAARIEQTFRRLSFVAMLNTSRQSGFFPDIDDTPFPTDAQLEAGVEVSLVMEGDLQQELKGTNLEPGIQFKKRNVLNDLIIHIVERNGIRYWQVQQRLDEPDEEGRLIVMFIATDSNVIGRDPAYNIVQGRP